MRSLKLSWVFALVASIAATSAFAAQPVRTQPPIDDRTPAPPIIRPIPVPIGTGNGTSPAPGQTIPAPGQRILPPLPVSGQYVGSVPVGTKVPLMRLPRLPMKTAMNTSTPRHSHLIRPMAANAGTIDVAAASSTCANSGGLGDQFAIGCIINWQAENNGSDSKQDYLVISTNGDERSTSAVAQSTAYGGGNGSNHNTTLSTAGTYILGVYDVTTSKWLTVVYVNAGTVFNVKVYQDSFHTQEQYQFAAQSGSNAYIYMQNVSQSDYFVVGIAQTGVNPNCVFLGPAPLPSPYAYPSNELCQLTASTGVQAPGGNLSVTWPLSSSYLGGTYAVEVYDVTLGERLGQVQVALTPSTGIAVVTYPDDTGSHSNPSPAPPTVGATPSTIVAWDGSQVDEAVTGVKTTVNGLSNGSNYLWVLSDPQGQVLGSQSGTIASNAGSNTFQFDNLTGGVSHNPKFLPPGDYPSSEFSIQLYDTTNKVVDAAQAFSVLGYSTSTYFNSSGTLGTSLAISPASPKLANIRFTNTSNQVWNGFGDNLSKVLFTTGPDFNATTTGTGVMLSVVPSAVNPCASCSETVADSAGNSWTITVTCTSAVAATNGECTVLATPVLASTTLAPGAYIDVTNVSWFVPNSSSCNSTQCQGLTIEYPQHGLHWSLTSSTVASTPVTFSNATATESSTAAFRFYGSSNQSGSDQPGALYGTHWFEQPYALADYNNNSPYVVSVTNSVNTSNTQIWALTIKNTGTQSVSEIAILLPALLLNQGFNSADTTLNNNWSSTGCPGTFSAQWICYNTSSSISSGSSDTAYIYETLTNQSFAFTDLQIQTLTSKGWAASTAALSAPAPVNPPDGRYSVDNLGIGVMSLAGGSMTSAFNPATTSTGGTSTLGWQFNNTSLSQDAFPDSIDLLVLEAPNTTVTLGNTPTVSTGGWSYLGKFTPTGGHNQYWFGLCAAQFTSGAVTGASYGGPPNATGVGTTPLAAKWPQVTSCGGSETSSAGPGGTVIASNMQFTSIGAAGSYTWKMYAHGTNGGGWSSSVPMTLTVSAETASIWFNQVNGTAVTTNTIPTIAGSPNTYQYAIKNTSNSTNISTAVVTLPGLDINNQNAYDGSQAWAVTNIITGGVTLTFPAGQGDGIGGCSVSTVPANTFNPTAGGANGQITISGCTTFKPGDTIYVNFSAANPSSQNDTYVFPAKVDGNSAGVQWLGSDEITEQFSLGLNIVVDPSNPGPGNSTPVVNCGTCTFAGTTVDFGNILNNASVTAADVVRTSIVYTGATSGGHNLQLYVSASQNPANSTGTPTNELQSLVDSTNSTSGASIVFNTTSYTVVPTGSPGLLMATAPETFRSTSYDVIDSYKVSIGAESTTGYTVTLTYTVVAI